MKTFKQFFFEETGRTAVIAYGRYNPPTIGHEKLTEKVREVANKESGDAFIVPSHTVDNKKNPLNFDEKSELLHHMVDGMQILSTGKTLISLLQDLQDKGYTNIIHVAGSDRIPEFQKLIEMYNCKEDKKGVIPFCFQSYTFESAGERDPDSDSVEGMSASKLRELAKAGNYDEFANGTSSKIPDKLKQQTYEIIRQRIK